jgi:hypothetical protein
MIKANQQQLLQSTNIALITLRQAEINYFSKFFTSFGTQSAVLSAMAINSATNIFGLVNSDCGIGWIYFFWVTTTMAFIFACRLLIATAFISNYGQGLALRGPSGSMVIAIDGMVKEQEEIVRGFWFTVSSSIFAHLCRIFGLIRYGCRYRCSGQLLV